MGTRIKKIMLVDSSWFVGEDSDNNDDVEVYIDTFICFKRRGGNEEIFFYKEEWEKILEFIKEELEKDANTNS